MLMACAFQRHLLGRDWRKSENIDTLRANPHYCDILRWFSDYPGPPHIYSIHHLVQCGMRYDKVLISIFSINLAKPSSSLS